MILLTKLRSVKVNYKLVIVIRRDLRMGTGKTCSQAAHAAVLGVENTRFLHSNWVRTWLEEGQAKIILKENIMLPVVTVQDMGLTQIQPGTTTCIGIGPAPSKIIDRVTNNLKLL
jgi:PTH2 family peptidyl-tRNA hydrolase